MSSPFPTGWDAGCALLALVDDPEDRRRRPVQLSEIITVNRQRCGYLGCHQPAHDISLSVPCRLSGIKGGPKAPAAILRCRNFYSCFNIKCVLIAVRTWERRRGGGACPEAVGGDPGGRCRGLFAADGRRRGWHACGLEGASTRGGRPRTYRPPRQDREDNRGRPVTRIRQRRRCRELRHRRAEQDGGTQRERR